MIILGESPKIRYNIIMMSRIKKMYCLCRQKNLRFYYYLYQYTSSSYIECNIFAQVSESISIYGNKIHLFRNSHTYKVYVCACREIFKLHNIIHNKVGTQRNVILYYTSKVILYIIFISLLFIQILDVTTIHLGIDLLLNLLQQRLLYMPNTIHALYIGLLLHTKFPLEFHYFPLNQSIVEFLHKKKLYLLSVHI